MSERIIDQGADDAERVAELALRPKTLGEFVGQLRVRDQLDLLLSAAKERKIQQITFYSLAHQDLVRQLLR